MMAAPQGPVAKSTSSRSPKRVRKAPGRAMTFILEMESGGGGKVEMGKTSIRLRRGPVRALQPCAGNLTVGLMGRALCQAV